MMCKSDGCTGANSILTRTSPGPGAEARANHAIGTTSDGSPLRSMTRAFMLSPSLESLSGSWPDGRDVVRRQRTPAWPAF